MVGGRYRKELYMNGKYPYLNEDDDDDDDDDDDYDDQRI
jgi:hypothetical protein